MRRLIDVKMEIARKVDSTILKQFGRIERIDANCLTKKDEYWWEW